MKDRKTKQYTGNIETTVQQFDWLIGKVFNHTELLGLPDRQLKAYRSSLRTMFWDWYNSHMENLSGLSDPSYQARVEAGIEPSSSSTSGGEGYAYNVIQ